MSTARAAPPRDPARCAGRAAPSRARARAARRRAHAPERAPRPRARGSLGARRLVIRLLPRRLAQRGTGRHRHLITLEQARSYFQTYYAPNAATLVRAGDGDAQDAFRLVERDVGAIPRRRPPLPVDATEPPQDGERRVVVRKNAELPAVMIGYHAPRALDPDRAPLDVVERLLSGGESARLHQDLVRSHEVATAVEANNTWGIDPDLFWIYAQARPKRTAAVLEERIDAVVEGLRAKPVPDDELAKAKRQLRAEYVEGLKTVSGKANKLGFFETVFGDYRALFGLEDAWRAVTADDVQRVARTYLVPTHRTVVVLEPVPAPGRPAASRAPPPRALSGRPRGS